MTTLDRRLHAYRDDVADLRLQGRVEAQRFTAGVARAVMAPIISVRKAPRFDAPQLTQAFLGETLRVFTEDEGWAFVQLDADGYVGYVAADALGEAGDPATHKVSVPSTFMYPEPSIKTQPAEVLPMLSAVTVRGSDGKFAQLANGRFVFAAHLSPRGSFESDPVAVAERFLHVPYYWGGKSASGIDCSGLAQVALTACGIAALRDSDMQEATLGNALPLDAITSLKRGDLLFWKGHVGLVRDEATLLHATGHFMQVVLEPLVAAITRIAAAGDPVTSIRRL
jgi:cell wall-associated NlpC family hydrolase